MSIHVNHEFVGPTVSFGTILPSKAAIKGRHHIFFVYDIFHFIHFFLMVVGAESMHPTKMVKMVVVTAVSTFVAKIPILVVILISRLTVLVRFMRIDWFITSFCP